MTELEAEVGTLIIDALSLEDVTIADIDPDAPLFNDGLGLDSVDALELSIAIHRKYGVKVQADDPNIKQTFESLRALASFISGQRTSEP